MRKILPALFVAHREGKLHQDGRIICLPKQQLSLESYLHRVNSSVAPYVKGGLTEESDAALWQSFLARISSA